MSEGRRTSARLASKRGRAAEPAAEPHETSRSKGTGRGRGGRKKEEAAGGEPAAKRQRVPRGKKTASQEEEERKKKEKEEGEAGEGAAVGGEEKKEEAGEEPEKKEKEKEGEAEVEEVEETDEADLRASTAAAQDEKARGIKFLEKGHIYFFYRPRVGVDETHGVQDIHRLYVLLGTKRARDQPHEHRIYRLLVVPRKTMPSIGHKGRHWAFVYKVTHDVKDVHSYLQEEQYDTETRGERTLGVARPAGEGFYSIIEHHGHTHLVYVLEQPEQPKEVQEALNINKEGSYIFSVKNPENVNPMFGGMTQKAEFPHELMEVFRGRKWAPVNPPTFLNHEGAELILIGVSDNLVEEFGKTGEQIEKEGEREIGHEKKSFFRELRISAEEFPPEPLLKGTWV